MKRNNPLNIRYNPNNDWLGQVSVENGFCVFTSEFCGMRAAVMVLLSYRKHGCTSIFDIIKRWAPPCENPTEYYINHVEKDFHTYGFAISRYTDFLNDNDLSRLTLLLSFLLFSMEYFENGMICHTLFDWYKFMVSPKIQKLIKERL